MLEALITQVLNKVLGDFIENIDPKQLDISVLNGNVMLTNMKIKSTIFDSMPLPFSLAFGQVGVISLKVPVWNMFNSPLVIEIRDVFALVKPKHVKEWNEDVEIKSFKNSNQSKLESFEVFNQNADTLIKKDPSSIDKLVGKIIDNLEVKVKNIYVRYEDEYSAPHYGNGKFSFGIKLKEFSTYTTGTDWLTKIMSKGEELTYKLAKIKGFELFLDYEDEKEDQPKNLVFFGKQGAQEVQEKYQIDYEALYNDKKNEVFQGILKKEFESKDLHHNYIVEYFSMEARLILNKKPSVNQEPQLNIDLILGGQFKNKEEDMCIGFNVHQPQIIRVLKLLEYIGYYNNFQKGALQNIGRKAINQELANEYIKLYCEWRVLKNYKKKDKEADEKRALMKLIEEEYPAEKIIVLRKFANKVFEQQEEVKQKQDEIDKQVKDMESKQKKGFFTSKEKKEQFKKEADEYRAKLQNQLVGSMELKVSELDYELQALTEDLSKSVVYNQEDFDKMPTGYMRFKFRISIPCLSFSFVNEFNQKISIAKIADQYASIDLGTGITKIYFRLQSISIQDLWTGAKAFPYILETKDINKEGEVQDNVNSDSIKNALTFSMEINDSYKICPFKMKLATERTLFLVANFHFVKEIQRSVIAAVKGEQLDFTYFADAATTKALQYIYEGKQFIKSIQKGEYKHQAFDIDLYLAAPVVVVPENIFRPEKSCLLLDTGAISLKSNLVPFNKEVDYKVIKSATSIYDKYEATLSNFQITVLENGLDKGLFSYKKGLGTKVINEFTASIILFNCVEPMHPLYPTVELSVVIQSFDICLSIQLAQSILKIQNAVTEQLASKEDQIFHNVSIVTKPSLQESLDKESLEKIRPSSMQQEKVESTDEEEFYGFIQSDVDERQELREKYNYKSLNDKELLIEEVKQGIQFKVFLSIEKFAIKLLKENNEDMMYYFMMLIDLQEYSNALFGS